MLKHIGAWYHHYDKAILPLVSSISGSALIYFQPNEGTSGWYEAFKIVLGVCGTLALAFFTFYYKKQSENDARSIQATEELKKTLEETAKNIRRDFEESLEKLEARLVKEILHHTLPLKDQAAAALLEVSAEKNIRLKQHVRYLQLFILVREAVKTQNCEELNITDIFKDPNA